jgi:TolB-like protein
MSSIIEGYNYDIFISYRQKDNKGDRWVSKFNDALKTELESTFKEEISVYFDINPHDGLLETHDVDASLKDKLKCLVFIPVISRTYCDPKSYAWEHEFKAFIEQASQDKYGLKVKLADGNVANRVLPIQIHDLDMADSKEFESALGGPLRGIEFIYKEPGVIPTVHEKSIAVLPFVDISPEKDQEYFCDGVTEEIINSLAHIESFKVIARTSSFAFKDKQVDIREIGRVLDVETLLEGSIRKISDKLRITAQLISVSDGSHIWSERYDREMKDVFVIQDEISQAIVDNLKIKLLSETKSVIARKHTTNIEAYNLFLKGTYCYQMSTSEGFEKAMEYFHLTWTLTTRSHI